MLAQTISVKLNILEQAVRIDSNQLRTLVHVHVVVQIAMVQIIKRLNKVDKLSPSQ